MERFECINLNFVRGLPEDEGYEQVLVVTCRLTKLAIFIPLPKKTLVLKKLLLNCYEKSSISTVFRDI